MRLLPSLFLPVALFASIANVLRAGDPPMVIPAPGSPPKLELKEAVPLINGQRMRTTGTGPSTLTPGHFRVFYLTGMDKATDIKWSVREMDLPDADMGKEKIVRSKEIPAKTQLFGRYEGSDVEDFHTFADATGGMFGIFVTKLEDGTYASGRIEVTAHVVTDGKLQTVTQRVDANMTGVPPPGPAPKPKPVPVTPGKRQIVIIEETSQAADQRALMFADPTLRDYIKSQGHVWRCVDKDVKQYDPATKTNITPPELTTFIKDAAGKTMPMIYVTVPGKPGSLAAETIPANAGPSWILDKIKANGG